MCFILFNLEFSFIFNFFYESTEKENSRSTITSFTATIANAVDFSGFVESLVDIDEEYLAESMDVGCK